MKKNSGSTTSEQAQRKGKRCLVRREIHRNTYKPKKRSMGSTSSCFARCCKSLHDEVAAESTPRIISTKRLERRQRSRRPSQTEKMAWGQTNMYPLLPLRKDNEIMNSMKPSIGSQNSKQVTW